MATSALAKTDKLPAAVSKILGKFVEQEPFSLPGDLSNDARVLVVDSGDLCDLLFFSPVMVHLRKRFPGMRISVLVREGNSEMVRNMEAVNEMISYEPAHLSFSSTTYFSLLRRLRSKNFDIVFLLGRKFDVVRSTAALYTNARLRVGYYQEKGHPFINCELRAKENQYEAPRALAFLNALGISPEGTSPGWKLSEADLKWGQQMVHFRKPSKSERLIVVDPGVGKGGHRLADDALRTVAERVADQFDGKLLVMSNSLDDKGLAKFRQGLGNALDLEPKNIKEALALLSCADLVLSGNTDYFHFAVSMKRPTIGMFTRHDGENWFPKNASMVQILQGATGQKLSVEEVCSKIDTLLHLTS